MVAHAVAPQRLPDRTRGPGVWAFAFSLFCSFLKTFAKNVPKIAATHVRHESEPQRRDDHETQPNNLSTPHDYLRRGLVTPHVAAIDKNKNEPKVGQGRVCGCRSVGKIDHLT